LSAILEGSAALLGLAYVVLAIRELRACWIAGALASLIFLFVFWEAGLVMQAGLQVYYVAIAVHAWLRWGRADDAATLTLSPMTGRAHAALIGLTLLACGATVVARDALADAAVWLDSATSWAGVAATWLVARKKLEAWLYWIVIDLATVALYIHAGLLASSALYALYTALAWIGFREWRKHYQIQSATPAGGPSGPETPGPPANPGRRASGAP